MKSKPTNELARFRCDLATVVLLSLVAILAPCASGATYYVSTTGSDSNSGTQTAPFLNVSKGVSAATQPGDTVIVENGTYGPNGAGNGSYAVTLNYSGTSGHPITIEAQNRGQATLDCQLTCSAYFNINNASFVVIQGFNIWNGYDAGIQSNGTAHDITIRWNDIGFVAHGRVIADQVGRDGIFLNSTEYDFTFDGNTIHDIGRASGETQNHFDHGIYSGASNTTIINNIFYNDDKGWPIQICGNTEASCSATTTNVLIANNTFALDNVVTGEAGQIMIWGTFSGLTIENNIFYSPTTSALTSYVPSVTGGSFDYNLVYGTTSTGAPSGMTVGAHNKSGDNPLFVNATTSPYNFYTQAGGAGIDAGVNLSQVPYDYVGTARPQGSSTDMGAYEYIASGAGPVISAVAASAMSTSSATITWATNQSSTSYVQYGLTSSYTSTTATNSTMVTSHAVAVSGLAASTTYHYRVASTNSSGVTTFSSDYTCTTMTAVAPPAPPAFAFSMSAASSSSSVVQGQSASDNITATLLSGSAATVSFTTSTLPAGVTAKFSSPSCTLTCTTAMTVSTSSSTAAGTYSIVVTGSSSGTSATTTVALTVTAAGTGTGGTGGTTGNITTGLVAEWKFTDGSGTHAADSSGDGNTATLYNPAWGASNYGMACSFSGSSSYGAVTESKSLEMTTQMTIGFWVRPGQSSGTDPRVISKLYDWDVQLNGSNRYPQLTAGGHYAELNYALPLSTWHHVVFTFSSGVMTGYVDGVAVPFAANTFTTSNSTLPNYAYNLYLAAYDGSLDDLFIGSLDDVRIYNRALSAADVAALYKALPKLN